MPGDEFHPWNVSIFEAGEIQKHLALEVRLDDHFRPIRKVCGIGLAFKPQLDQVIASACPFSFTDLKLIQARVRKEQSSYPYQSGHLAFSAGPVILSLFEQIERPDLAIFPVGEWSTPGD